MVDPLKNIGLVILAAGRGKRMQASAEQPKVLIPLLGKPLLRHLLDHIGESSIKTKPVVVIAPDLYVIRENIGPICEYAIQETQLGTGHAVLSAKEKLYKYEHVLVLYGDHPLVSARTIDMLVKRHVENNADLTLATLRVPNFEDWYSFFTCYGRIVRNGQGRIYGIVEKKDASKEEQAITEVNPGYYMFRTSFLWSALPKLNRDNSPKEYYLTDIIKIALTEGKHIQEIELQDAREGLGINTPDQLALMENVLQSRLDAQARMHTAKLPL